MVQKCAFALGHSAIVLICAWLVLGNGWEVLGSAFGKNWSLADLPRAQILLGCAFIYWIRHLITLFYLLERKVEWSEALGLLIFMGLFEIGLLLLGGGAFRNNAVQPGLFDYVAFALYLGGSFLNSFSEIQRKWWKENPANRGHCYTKGLFGYSMHINYFGDTVLFTGWSLFTGNVWILGFPILMGLSFVFFHIPNLDSYLAERYGEEFRLLFIFSIQSSLRDFNSVHTAFSRH